MRKLFEKYGKAGEVFIHKDKGFGFIRLVSDMLPLGCFVAVTGSVGGVLLIENSRCSDSLLVKSLVHFSNLEYGISSHKWFV